jgi:exodeoxyribonuclease VII small subunit
MAPVTFEERLSRLEQLGASLREGNVPLDEATTLFEEGVKLARGLEKELAKVERKIEILVNEPTKGDTEPSLDLFPGLESDATGPL